ncbi:DUF1697 domain-containing protein [Engelhardtia mirabilis]|uniref:DUF1697 domain-containing protein n=1 Tax=Engelhardtia mirabilis TaxID=2528011 RepID=A0A518BQN5_9BACT|nr:hypothetical protein Pla133_43980 [Planctomycetes bacterium Pla133]QDV03606.1 hypothetical protein Pla86_43970 [Planctomycetes bacterium Pla86]
MRYVALLRGVNVGGKRRVPMAELAAILEGLGCTNVATHLQSGNAVFTATATLAKRLPQLAAAALEERFGFAVPVVVRSARQLQVLFLGNPYALEGAPEDSLFVGFLSREPSARQVKALDPERSPGDRFAVVGADAFLHLPNGVARTKLDNDWFDRHLDAVITVRNWRTVAALVERTCG